MVKKLTSAARKRIVPKFYRKWTFQLSSTCAAITITLPALLIQYKDVLPPWWVGIGFLVIAVAAVVTQKNLPSAK